MFNDAPLDATPKNEPSREVRARPRSLSAFAHAAGRPSRVVLLFVLIGVALAVSAAAIAIAIAGSSSSTVTTTTFGPGTHGGPGGGAFSVPQSQSPAIPGGGGRFSVPQSQGQATGGGSASGAAAASGSDVATYYGHVLAGKAPRSVSLARAEALGNEVPPGAQVNRATGTIRFTGSQVRLVVVASPPSGDMKFRTAGINDPTIEVPAGAGITLEFINGDSDMAHMWLLVAGEGNSDSFGPGGHGAGHIAAAPPLGDPTSAGQPAETVNFNAPEVGTYRYLCPFPGHAVEGMSGRFVVQSA